MKQLVMKDFISGDGIELLGLSRRAYNTLMRAGITQIGQIVQTTEQDLLLVRNLGVLPNPI
jgi:DNA-directed RNA polymerase subunit alpha